ncbi:hypothetical protein COLO4_08877 [Corchorus olitorius]|uniref:Uncharacterized protein n=1 Tax=Corchorus olitorius TaxID=93759 RepID=A0A1R3KED3_9ROSI|nr:hypothetical protein COLO4_08877 [Corchorus olitorius]
MRPNGSTQTSHQDQYVHAPTETQAYQMLPRATVEPSQRVEPAGRNSCITIAEVATLLEKERSKTVAGQVAFVVHNAESSEGSMIDAAVKDVTIVALQRTFRFKRKEGGEIGARHRAGFIRRRTSVGVTTKEFRRGGAEKGLGLRASEEEEEKKEKGKG